MHFLMPTVFSSHSDFREWFSNPLTGMVEGSQEYSESIVKRLHQVYLCVINYMCMLYVKIFFYYIQACLQLFLYTATFNFPPGPTAFLTASAEDGSGEADAKKI